MKSMIRLFREDGAADGAAALPPSLAELETGLRADGTPLPNIAEPTPDPEPTPLKFGDAGYVLQPGDEGYVDPNAPIDEPIDEPIDDLPPAGDFWAEVEKITGTPLNLEYPDGTEPDTPEGAAFRELAVRDQAQKEFETYLATSDPRAYAYMLHRAAGLPDEEFFGDSKGYTLPQIEELNDSIQAQASIYKYDLINRGLDDDIAQALVEKAIKDNNLKDKAVASHKIIAQAQAQQLDQLQQKQTTNEQAFQQASHQMVQRITTAIENELGFVVPANKKAEFSQFITNNMEFENGKFYLVQEVANDANFKNQMEAMFFQYVKGDLSTVVKKQVKTEAAQRLRLATNKAVEHNRGGQSNAPSGKLNIPLGDL